MKNISYRLFFRALNNDGRLSIVQMLRHGPRTVLGISRELGMEQSLVSHNLKCLAGCGFVNMEKTGNQRIYSLDRETVLPALRAIDRHIDRFGERLRECGIVGRHRRVVHARV